MTSAGHMLAKTKTSPPFQFRIREERNQYGAGVVSGISRRRPFQRPSCSTDCNESLPRLFLEQVYPDEQRLQIFCAACKVTLERPSLEVLV